MDLQKKSFIEPAESCPRRGTLLPPAITGGVTNG